MPSEPQQPEQRPAQAINALMYCAALIAGVVLVVAGHATPVEASGYVSPFLVIFEGTKSRSHG
ncbi:hypothetical protein [Streptomyces sp. STR69]|uniref:hypothetical protein n=1 Tax=Streptomyces sp. STR69 TaxID=1796942 RepID=UPI0021C86D4C|nr:hypothetical protein [Streptomyces sp. STR69]